MLVEKQNTVKSTRFDGFWTLDSLLVSGKVWLKLHFYHSLRGKSAEKVGVWTVQDDIIRILLPCA